LKNFDEKGSSPLTMATARNGASYLYVVHAGYPGDPGDAGDYQGHISAIALSDGTQHVFNALCSNQVDVHFQEAPQAPACSERQAGLWARSGVVYDAAMDRIYATASNGDFNPGARDWGDTVLALRPDGSSNGGMPLDSYTPSDYQALQNGDMDLGSTTVALLPAPAASAYRHLALQGGKDRALHLLDLDNMSGEGGPGNVGGELQPIFQLPVGGEMHTTPAVWVNPQDNSTWVFVTAWYGIVGMQLSTNGNGVPQLDVRWTRPEGGTSPLVANGLLYEVSSYNIRARDPLTGDVLWQTTQLGAIHWQSPVLINGVLYVTDQSRGLNAYALP
ncbi:MAG: hypothetical protein LC737_04065, partial [Chloroflexi bacterium]|nr:hypothetical protein [Chloroflexota bacterium]